MFRSWKGSWETWRYIRAVQKEELRENVILLESKNAKDLAGNIYRLLEVLQAESFEQFEVYLSIRGGSRERVQALTDKKGITRYKMVAYGSREYYHLLATAKYIVEDTSFPAKFMKKEGQVYLNTWHGTPLKLMGRDEEAGAYAIGNIQKNFFCADYLLYPNQYMKDLMFSAYMLDELYEGTVIYEGYPRNSIFFDQNSREVLREELGIADKQVAVYMPTWRGGVNDYSSTAMEEAASCYFDVLDELLTDEQVFYVKFHVFATKNFPFEDYKHIRPFPDGYEAYELLNVADVLVTDYSSVFFDFANTGRKIILFPYDYEEYIGVRGLYTDLESLPFPKVYSAKALAEELARPKNYDDTEFMAKYCSYDNPDAAMRLARHVFLGETVCKTENCGRAESVSNDSDKEKPKKILVYSSGLERNGITTSLLNLMSCMDKEKNHYYLTFFQASLKNAPERIRLIPEGVRFFPINGSITDRTPAELIAFKLFYGLGLDCKPVYHYVRRLYAREFQKHFGAVKFDGVVHYTGYAKDITTLLSTAPCKTAMFIHNDMMQEVKTKGNQYLPTLRHAYHEYDAVVPVSNSVWDSIREITDNDRVIVIENTHNDRGVKERAELSLEVEPETLISVSFGKLKEMLEDDSLERFVNIGRYSPEKGHIKLLEAFERYHAEHPESRLIIIGGYGSYYTEVAQYANSLACADAVVLIRAILNPFPIVKRCQLFLLASDYEALALVLLEAESLGVPAVATDIPGSGDLMRKHGGYIVENSAEGLYQGMCAYREGKVHTMGICFDNYNQESAEKFDALFWK